MPCLFLNTERGFGGKPPKKSGFRRHLAGSKMPKETFFTAISRWRVVSRRALDASVFGRGSRSQRYGIVRISALSQAASEEGYRRAAVERGPRSFDARRFIECAELVENRARLHEKLTGRREVSGDLAQCRARHHGSREVIARADAFQDLHRGLDIRFGGSGGLWREAFCHQPARRTFEMGVAQSLARLQQSIDHGLGGYTIAPAK